MSSSDLTSAAMRCCAFPGDIILEILLRLPVKSLLRFRCVCKSWFSVITSPSFVTKHLTQNTNENLIISCGGHINSEAAISMLIYGKKTLDRSINMELPFPGSIVKIVGSCNGLICCITQWRLGWKMSLWNPSTREYRNLPKPGITAVELLLRCCSICLGFGFDAKANDYKLVRLLCCMDLQLQPIYKAEVYSKNKDSWKEINAVLQCCASDSSPSVFFGGGVHWIASGSGRSELIAYFDLDGEGFGEIQLPDSFGFGITTAKELAVFKDFLAVVSTSGRDLNRCIDVWVMKEYGVKESWIQQLSIVPFPGVVRQMACFRNGNFVLQNYQDRLFLYNSNTQELDELPVCSAGYIHDIHTCMESLVSIREGT